MQGKDQAESPAAHSVMEKEGTELVLSTSDSFCLATARVPDAAALSPLAFQRATTLAYQELRTVLGGQSAWHPVRFWNFIPDIHAPSAGGMDRYMVFNAGRFAAFDDWYGGKESFDGCMATATGVGHDGRDLMIHVLAARTIGEQIENPRQTSSYRYSERYGPLPPCFARATLIHGSGSGTRMLLIGGTSSVRGEASLHPGDAVAQTRETLDNLSSLIGAAMRHSGRNEQPMGASEDVLGLLKSLRLYGKQQNDVHDVVAVLRDRVPHLTVESLEVIRADICRPELLVEIEGTAAWKEVV